MIQVEQLSFRYAVGAFELQVPALEVAAGSRVALTGPSGCGKTTLLHLVSGVLRPDRGRITVDGTHVGSLGEAERRDFRLRTVGLVFQEFELLEYLDVVDNVLLPYRLGGSLTLDRVVRDRARALIDQVGLTPMIRKPPARLSQGERQRVAVCRALITQPRLLLADEPTGNLDPDNKQRVLELLLRLCESAGATLLTVTHDHGLLSRFDAVQDFAELTAVGVSP